MKMKLTLSLLAALAALLPRPLASNEIYPTAEPVCNPSACWYENFFIHADALYVTTAEDGLDFGESRNGPCRALNVDTTSKIETLIPGFDRHFAWRAGIGYEDPCGCLGFNFNWTHLLNKAQRKYKSNTIPFWIFWSLDDSNEAMLANKSKAHLNLNLNLYDLECGKYFAFSDWMQWRPHIGLRYASIDQHYKIHSQAPANEGDGVDTDRLFMTNDYKGVGLRGGLDVKWDIGCGFNLFGSLAGSILWGTFDLKSYHNFQSTSTAETNFILKMTDHLHSAKANTDLALGLSWCYPLLCAQWMEFSLAYEYHLFFNQNQFRNQLLPTVNDSIKNPGNLSFHGLSLSATYHF